MLEPLPTEIADRHRSPDKTTDANHAPPSAVFLLVIPAEVVH